MKYELLAFQGQRACEEAWASCCDVCILGLIESSKTATMPEGLSGDHLQIEAINDLEDSLDKEEYGDSHLEVSMG